MSKHAYAIHPHNAEPYMNLVEWILYGAAYQIVYTRRYWKIPAKVYAAAQKVCVEGVRLSRDVTKRKG